MADVLNGPSVALYRLFGRAGELLYVGVTSDPRTRWAQHKAEKPWWPDVHRYTLEWRSSRDAALKEEAEVIVRERPAHNVMGATIPPTRRAVPPVVRLPDPDALLSIRDITVHHGISRQALHNHRQHPEFPVPVATAGSSRPRWHAGGVAAYFTAHPKRPGERTDLTRERDNGALPTDE
ncbi:GIY-YIG nuclease family protein [Streptomyces sp. NPDC088253]|uniref:GIY-YIG nuclease family protein n=1 Tax=Streptomyces sp. NPDC088253 TaxID=3365846 RepID=UPI0037F20224